MKAFFIKLRDTFIAGLIFLLPLLILVVLFTKVFQFLTGFTDKVAAVFGLTGFIGISGGTILSALGLILFCIICGYLMRIAFFKALSAWVDQKLMSNIPGYSAYREMALSKLEENKRPLPYKCAAWINEGDTVLPAFLMETMDDGRLVMFIPTAGSTMTGKVIILPATRVTLLPQTDVKAMKIALDSLGIGLSKI